MSRRDSKQLQTPHVKERRLSVLSVHGKGKIQGTVVVLVLS